MLLSREPITMTFAPSAYRRWAEARPIPLVLPVTRTMRLSTQLSKRFIVFYPAYAARKSNDRWNLASDHLKVNDPPKKKGR